MSIAPKKLTQAEVELSIRARLSPAGDSGVFKADLARELRAAGVTAPMQKKALDAMINRGQVEPSNTDEEWTLARGWRGR